jgi:hypothetical protein
MEAGHNSRLILVPSHNLPVMHNVLPMERNASRTKRNALQTKHNVLPKLRRKLWKTPMRNRVSLLLTSFISKNSPGTQQPYELNWILTDMLLVSRY